MKNAGGVVVKIAVSVFWVLLAILALARFVFEEETGMTVIVTVAWILLLLHVVCSIGIIVFWDELKND